jgi:hypothetical protein
MVGIAVAKQWFLLTRTNLSGHGKQKPMRSKIVTAKRGIDLVKKGFEIHTFAAGSKSYQKHERRKEKTSIELLSFRPLL